MYKKYINPHNAFGSVLTRKKYIISKTCFKTLKIHTINFLQIFYNYFFKTYKHLKYGYTFRVQIIFDSDMYGAPLGVKNTFHYIIYEFILVSKMFVKYI